MSKIEVLGGKPDLKKLAKAGRIKLTPTGDVEGQPQNNVLYVQEKQIKHESGIVIGTQKIEVNGGHVRAIDSVWRVALSGPKKYHEKVLKDEKRKVRVGEIGFRPSTPELTDEEFAEYTEYKAFLKEKNAEIAEDAEFYAWKAGSKKKKKEETL